MRPIHYAPGELILAQDEYHNDKIFILFNGSVQVRVRGRIEGGKF